MHKLHTQIYLVAPSGVGGANGVDFNDDVKARFGTGNDLEIYHDGNDSVIKDSAGTGAYFIQTNKLQIVKQIIVIE